MAENPTIFQLVQLGVEVTPGTLVAATKRMTSLEITPSIKPEVKLYRPSGYRFPTVAALSKEWTEAPIQGPVTYTEIIYLLNSLIKAVTPTGAGADKTWVFAPTSNASDTRKTYSIESGSADRARRFGYGLVSGLQLTFNRNECTLQGTMLGKAVADNFTLTALTSANEVALVPVLPTQGTLKLADTQAGLAGATAAARVFSMTWGMQNMSGPVWPINATSTFAAMTDLVPTCEGTIKMAVNAEGMALLTNLRAGSTKFARLTYTGDTVGAGDYTLQIDVAMKISNVKPFSDEEGVFAVEWDYTMTHDSTWGKGTEVTVVNALGTL